MDQYVERSIPKINSQQSHLIKRLNNLCDQVIIKI